MAGDHVPDDQACARFWRIPEFGGLEALHAVYPRRLFPRHMHEEYVIAVMTLGSEAIECKGVHHVVSRGQVILLNPGEWHANSGLTERFGYRTMYVSIPFLVQLGSDFGDDECRAPALPCLPVSDDPRLGSLLLRFHSALARGAAPLESQTYLLESLAYLFFRHDYAGVAKPPPVRAHWICRVREYIDAGYDRDISLRDVSAIAGVTPFRLVRAFRSQVGVPPHAYQTHCRVAHAKTLLRAGMPIPEVAAAVGFFDQSHLHRHFGRIVGLTPYRFQAAITYKTKTAMAQ